MTEAVFFYLFTAILLAFAAAVVWSRSPMAAVLSLLVVMFSAACLYVMLGAYFLAAVQLLLYAGAVVVLFLFVMMLLNPQAEPVLTRRWLRLPALGSAAAMLLLFIFCRVFAAMPSAGAAIGPAPSGEGHVEALGRLLFTRYLLPFELVSFIILSAIIGAVTLARQERRR